MKPKYAPYSHSKLSCHEGCPFAFKCKYIQKIKVPPGDQRFFEKGNFFHYCLEHYPTPPPKPWVFEHTNPRTQQIYLEQVRDFIKHEKTQYYLKECKSKAEMEFKIFGDLNNYKPDFNRSKWQSLIYGYIDRFIVHDEFGVVTIIDWKSKHKIEEGYEPDEQQMHLYAAWAFMAFEKVHTVRCSYGFVENNEFWEKEYNREPDADWLEESVINRITKVETDTNFNKRITDACKWCDYYDHCKPHKIEVKR